MMVKNQEEGTEKRRGLPNVARRVNALTAGRGHLLFFKSNSIIIRHSLTDLSHEHIKQSKSGIILA